MNLDLVASDGKCLEDAALDLSSESDHAYGTKSLTIS